MNKKLIALGPRWNNTSIETFLPEHTRDVLRTAQEQGNVILITSARHWEMTKWVYDAIGIRGPVCLLNGALVLDPYNEGFPRSETPMSSEAVQKILNGIFGALTPTRAYIEYDSYCWKLNDDHPPYYAERLKHSIEAYYTPESIPDTPASRLQIFSDNEEDIRRIPDIAAGYPGIRAIVTRNTRDWKCSVLDERVDKWEAVRYVSRVLGIPDEDIYAFGDQWNDFRMVSQAAHGYGIMVRLRRSFPAMLQNLAAKKYGVADIIKPGNPELICCLIIKKF